LIIMERGRIVADGEPARCSPVLTSRACSASR
jgi:hypothetical protein